MTSDVSNSQNIVSFDLNLLVVFEAIFINSSVSIAAKKLNASPSAISQSLNRLRIYFSDPLFVRKGQGLVPTTVAINLYDKIIKDLGGLANTLSNFSHSDIQNKFIIYSSPYAALRFMPLLCKAVMEEGLPYELVHISADALLDGGQDILTYRKADIVVDTRQFYGNSTITKLCMQDVIVAVCSKSHPRLDVTLGDGDFSHEKFIRADLRTHGVQKVRTEIEEHFRDRAFAFTSSCIDVNAAVAEHTDAIAFVTKWFFDKYGESCNLKTLNVNFEINPIKYYVTYNKSSMNNAHFAKFIDVVNNIFL